MKNLSCYRVIKSQEEKAMKTLTILAVLLSLFLASCKSTYDASAPYDEVYSSGKQDKNVAAKDVTVVGQNVTVQSQPVESTTAYQGDYYSPNYASGEFDSAGYYDYEYSSRVKRFQNENPGFDYYDNYYTDNYYYNNDPYAMNSSIYDGYGCCSPGLSLGFGLGYGWGGYYGMGYPYYAYSPYWGYYDPWYYPYYGGWGYGYPGYGYGSYLAGYYDGYYDGYYGGGYYPYPETDPHGHYYGPRGSRSGSSDGDKSPGSLTRNNNTVGGGGDNTRSFDQGASGSGSAGIIPVTGSTASASKGFVSGTNNTSSQVTKTTGTTHAVVGGATQTKSKDAGTTPAVIGGVTRTKSKDPGTGIAQVTKDAGTGIAPLTKDAGTATRSSLPKPGSTTTMSASRKVQPEMIYEKPRTYTSPAARTTPSKQEYISPGTRDTRTFSGQEANDNTRKVYTTTPERKSNVSGSPSTREGGSNTRYNSGTPSQKYSTPDRPSSRNTYTAPSSSGSRSNSAPSRSYSAPSSGSSGGGATRSGGSGGGGSNSGGGSHSGGGGSSRGGR